MRRYLAALERDARELLTECKPNDVLTHVAQASAFAASSSLTVAQRRARTPSRARHGFRY